jgi:hypothetical protein
MLKKLFGFGKKSSPQSDPEAARLGVDLEMSYCPGCGDEYRSGIEQCVTCRVPLISGAEKLAQVRSREQAFNGRSMEISADDQLVTIRNGKLRDVKPYQLILAKERIPSMIRGEAGGCGKG